MASFVQSAVGEADPAVPTLSVGATAGNLLVILAMERSGATSATTPTDWTALLERYPNSGDGTYRRSIVMFYKVATGGETSASIAMSSTGTIKAIIAEFALDTGNGENQWVLEADIDNDNGTTSNASSIGSGNTASVSGERHFLLAGWILKNTGSGTTPSALSFSGDVTAQIESIAASNGRTIALGYGTTLTDGVQAVTASHTDGGGNLGLAIGLAVFNVKSSGGGGPTGKPWYYYAQN